MSAKEAVLGGAAPAGERLLHELGEELGEHAGASVFAPPVERDGLTVIPSVPPGGVSEPDRTASPPREARESGVAAAPWSLRSAT